jgi:histidinol-phosphate phosphatase family protein
MTPEVDIVVPTVGRPSLQTLLGALAADAPVPGRVLVVDDRPDRRAPLPVPAWAQVVPGPARGPAAARNAGWRAGRAEWVAFLDDDVVPEAGWFAALATDLVALDHTVGGSQGRITVPLPLARRPTDYERDVAGLAIARWITADMAYRRAALAAVGGFDERFPRAYREDADLASRVSAAGWTLVDGSRVTAHPVRPATRWVSVRRQAGNADDVLLRVLYGRHWRARLGIPKGRRGRHLVTTAAGAAAVGCVVTGHRRLAAGAGIAWLAATAELAAARIAPGPRTADEVLTMVATSAVLPAAATGHWLRGWLTLPSRLRPPVPPPAAVLFDRDGTLVVDVPYNGDPDRVVPMPGARRALDRLRAAGVPTAVVSNQSGVARGLLTLGAVEAVNRQVEDLLGPLGPWLVCPHGDEDGCDCRKPAPGLVLQAADRLQVDPANVVVVGDIAADMEAARRAGARGILVPTAATRPDEVQSAAEVAADLDGAVRLVLGGR